MTWANVDKEVNLTERNLVELKLEEGVLATPVAFTSAASNGDSETLIITPSRACRKMVVIIHETGNQAAIKVDCSAGSFWAGKKLAQTTINQQTAKAFVFEAAKHYGNKETGSQKDAAENRIQIQVTADGSHKLGGDHAAKWQVLQLP